MRMRDFFGDNPQDSKILLSNLIDHISDFVAICDSKGKIQLHSRRFKNALRDTYLGPVPTDFADIIDASCRFEYLKLLEYVERERKPVIDFRIKTNLVSGGVEPLLSIIPSGTKPESTVRLLHIIRPSAHQEPTTPDFGQFEKLTNIGKIAAGIAHEMNTPLGSIILSAEHIMEAVSDKDLAQEAERIKNRAEYCSKVVKELLGYVRRDDQPAQRYSLLNIVNKLVDLVSSDAKRRKIELVVNETEGDAIIECSENQIEQLLFNLIANASQAIGRDGRIEISFRRDHLLHRIYIVITDNGSGISPDNIPKIFDPFFTTKPGAQGTGLGLALCKKIVLEHGGDITVKSEVGQGTTFEVWMPLENE